MHELIPRRPTSMNMNMSMSMSMSSACLPACFLFLFWAELLIDLITSVLSHACTHTNKYVPRAVHRFDQIHGDYFTRPCIGEEGIARLSVNTLELAGGFTVIFPVLFARVASLALLPSLHAIARSQTKYCCCCSCSGKAVHGTSSFSQVLFLALC